MDKHTDGQTQNNKSILFAPGHKNTSFPQTNDPEYGSPRFLKINFSVSISLP